MIDHVREEHVWRKTPLRPGALDGYSLTGVHLGEGMVILGGLEIRHDRVRPPRKA